MEQGNNWESEVLSMAEHRARPVFSKQTWLHSNELLNLLKWDWFLSPGSGTVIASH